jgi:hypothetical protein
MRAFARAWARARAAQTAVRSAAPRSRGARARAGPGRFDIDSGDIISSIDNPVYRTTGRKI